ncbi:hypothetical protein FRX31_028220, partial [Thalictrum thalictroides]
KDFGRTLYASYYHALSPTAAVGVECSWFIRVEVQTLHIYWYLETVLQPRPDYAQSREALLLQTCVVVIDYVGP